MAKTLYQCVACKSVVEKQTPACTVCDTANAVHKAPKGAKLPKPPKPMFDGFGRGSDFDDLDEDGFDFGGAAPEPPSEAIPLGDVDIEHPDRVSFGMKGLNRVLGKNRRSAGPFGAARGSCLMLKAKPGIGKTTLSMQISKYLAKKGHKVVIGTGEQSASDVHIYAEAFGELTRREKKNILILKTQSTDDLIAAVEEHEPLMLVVDSVQMMKSQHVEGRAASEPQCHYIHHSLVVDVCKPLGTITMLISQVTKEGEFRGPNTLAHLADADFVMEREDEDDENNQNRKLFAETKNRFGEAGVVARFKMTDHGLVGLKDKAEEPKKSKFKRRR